MKVYAISEGEMDERLNLDKRRNARAFCLCFESWDEVPAGFFDLQNELRDALEEEFWANFAEGKEEPRYEWASPSNKWFYFNGDMIGSERIDVDLTDNIIGDKLFGIIMAYLGKNAPNFCALVAVYKGEMKGKNYIGRFAINHEEIAVEESLVQLWTKQVQFMEIEKR